VIRSAKLQVGRSLASGSLPSQVTQFWVLAVFLCLVFATGGSTWPDQPHLIVLRPVAFLVAGYALLTMQPKHWRDFRAIWWLLGAVIALTVLHLVPLPPDIWRQLPGRRLIAEIDDVAGLHEVWRPLSMVPEATRNAAYSLAVPVAVALLAAQLDDAMHRRLLLVLLGLGALSGAISLAQAAGIDWQLYERTTPLSGLFMNRNHQALLLVLMIPISAAWASLQADSEQSARFAKIFPIAVAIVIIPLVILTRSRSGVITGGLALACLPLFWPARTRRGAENLRHIALARVGWVFSILVVALLWYAIAASRDTAIDRLQGAGEDLRLPVWSSIVDAMGHYFPWGSGIGSYEQAYQVLEPAELLRPRYSNHAHNEWLEIAFTAGLPGLVLLAAAALLLGWAAWRSFRGSGASTVFNRLGVLALFMLAIASTPDYPVRTPILSAMLALAAIWATPRRRTGPLAAAE
jgi:O-antigen ligase